LRYPRAVLVLGGSDSPVACGVLAVDVKPVAGRHLLVGVKVVRLQGTGSLLLPEGHVSTTRTPAQFHRWCARSVLLLFPEGVACY